MKKTILTSIISVLSIFVSAKAPDNPVYLKWDQNVPVNKEFNCNIMFPENEKVFVSESNPEVYNETDYRKNAVFFELFGPGVFYSINYDRRIKQHLSLRAGFTSWNLHGGLFTLLGIEKLSMTAFPVMINYITGPMKSSHFEIGAGMMPSFVSGKAFFTDEEASSETVLLGIGSIGYRYQQPDGGFFFRASITPLFSQYGAAVSGGLSFGFGF